MGYPFKDALDAYVVAHKLNPNVVLPLINSAITEGSNGVVTAVAITPDTVVAQKAATTIQFAAVVTGTGGFGETVTWSVTGNEEGTKIDKNGLLTIVAAEFVPEEHDITVTATSDFDDTVSDSVTVTCNQVVEEEA